MQLPVPLPRRCGGIYACYRPKPANMSSRDLLTEILDLEGPLIYLMRSYAHRRNKFAQDPCTEVTGGSEPSSVPTTGDIPERGVTRSCWVSGVGPKTRSIEYPFRPAVAGANCLIVLSMMGCCPTAPASGPREYRRTAHFGLRYLTLYAAAGLH